MGKGNELLIQETRGYLNLWIFFEYFIIYKDNIQHLLTIRKLFFKYIFQVDTECNELIRRKDMNYEEKDLIWEQIKRIKFCIRTCDFPELANIFNTVSIELRHNKFVYEKYPKVNLELATIFEYLSTYSKNYETIISSEVGEAERVNVNRNVKSLNFECENVIKRIDSFLDREKMPKYEVDPLLIEIKSILKILTGDLNEIRSLCEDSKEYILMNIYYRFHIKDFLSDLSNTLQGEETDRLDKYLCSIIKNSPLEFYSDIRNEIPKWLHFHLMDLMYDKELLCSHTGKFLDNMSLKDYDYTEFISYLLQLDVDYVNFFNYTVLYASNDANAKTYIVAMEKVVTRTIVKEFNKYEKNPNENEEKELKELLYLIAKEVSKMKDSTQLIITFSKLCYTKFFELGHYDSSVEFFFLNQNFSELHLPLLDKLFHLILLEDSIPINFNNLLKLNIENDKILFLINLINFTNIFKGKNEDYRIDCSMKIKYFFDFCFVEKKCPKVMWLWIIRLFRKMLETHHDFFKDIKFNDYTIAFVNTKSLKIMIKDALINFFEVYENELNFKKNIFLLKKAEITDLLALIENECSSCASILFNCQNNSFTNLDF